MSEDHEEKERERTYCYRARHQEGQEGQARQAEVEVVDFGEHDRERFEPQEEYGVLYVDEYGRQNVQGDELTYEAQVDISKE